MTWVEYQWLTRTNSESLRLVSPTLPSVGVSVFFTPFAFWLCMVFSYRVSVFLPPLSARSSQAVRIFTPASSVEAGILC